MPIQTDEIALSKEVIDLLRAKSAVEEYRVTEQLIRETFPELLGLDVYLQEDPDEEGITRVVLDVILPEAMPFDVLSARRNAYHTERRRRLPTIEWPVCGLSINFA